MCDPVSIGIALATSMAKSYFQNQAADERSDAQLAAQRAFSADLDAQRKPAQAAFQQSLQDVSRENLEKTREQKIDERIASIPRTDQRLMLPGQGEASDAVRTAIVDAQNKNIAKGDDLDSRYAALEAFGDAELGRNIAILRNSQDIDRYADFARGATPLLEADLNAAQYAGDKYDSMADAVGAIGSIAGAAAPGFGSTAGDVTNVLGAAGGATGATSIANNPGYGIYLGQTGNDPFAAGLNKINFNANRISGI